MTHITSLIWKSFWLVLLVVRVPGVQSLNKNINHLVDLSEELVYVYGYDDGSGEIVNSQFQTI